MEAIFVSAATEPDRVALTTVIELLRARYGTARSSLGADARQQLQASIALAGHHGVVAALAGGLRSLVGQGLEWQDLLPFVELFEVENRTRNQSIYTFARNTIAHLEAADIRAVVLKGGAFLVTSDDSAAWRYLSDLDALVLQNDVLSAASRLQSQGYTESKDEAGFHAGLHHHYPALSDGSGHFVELHTRLAPAVGATPVSTEAILERAVIIHKKGQTFLVPCPEHRMIHLVAHAQISNWGFALRQIQLKDIVDMAELVQRHDIDWDIVRAHFQTVRAEAELFGLILAAHELIGLEHPFPHKKLAADHAWARTAINAMYQPSPAWQTSIYMAHQYLKQFTRDPRRLKLAWQTLTDPKRRESLLALNRRRLTRRD